MHWINRGAMAIPTPAGSLLNLKLTDATLLLPLLPLIKGALPC